jgi:isoleucyl-tRNA synthetase
MARDLVRRVQTMRKDAGFQLDDRIVTYYEAGDELKAVVEQWGDYIRAETLSQELVPGAVPGEVDHQESFALGGLPLALGVKKA